MKPGAIKLNIDTLVLHGFAPGDRHLIGEAVQQELSRLLSEQGLPPGLAQGGALPRLDAGRFEVAVRSPAETVGTQVAQTVFTGLKGPG